MRGLVKEVARTVRHAHLVPARPAHLLVANDDRLSYGRCRRRPRLRLHDLASRFVPRGLARGAEGT